jgi:signal transduction histidine kinase
MARETAPEARLADSDVIESLGTPVVIARPPGVLSLMNRAAREITGLEARIGQPLEETMRVFGATDADGKPYSESALMAALAGRESEGDSTFKNLRTGEAHVVHWIARPVRAADGSVVAAVSTMYDLTELRRVEDEKEQFLSIVSHELRTPLTPLKALAQLLISRIRKSREQEKPIDLDSLERNLASIERQVDRMNRLVTDLLSVSRAGRGTLEMDRVPFDLATTVRDTVEHYEEATQEEGRHRFVVSAPDTLVVNGDETRIAQMLMNLIGNAVKYSPRGGEVKVALSAKGGEAEIVITDQGIGISAHDLARLGSAFTRGTGKAQTFAGMGIGLHVAKLMAEAHGGSLDIESPGEDRGTTVRVTLPQK